MANLDLSETELSFVEKQQLVSVGKLLPVTAADRMRVTQTVAAGNRAMAVDGNVEPASLVVDMVTTVAEVETEN